MNGAPENGKARIHRWAAWPAAIATTLTMLAGGPIAAYYIGRGVGSNEYILNLPADLKATRESLEKKIEDAQARDSLAFNTQVKINEDLLKTLNDLRRDLSVNDALDTGQRASIERLERQTEALRDLINKR